MYKHQLIISFFIIACLVLLINMKSKKKEKFYDYNQFSYVPYDLDKKALYYKKSYPYVKPPFNEYFGNSSIYQFSPKIKDSDKKGMMISFFFLSIGIIYLIYTNYE